MEEKKENKQPISRKKFLQVVGTVVAGGSIVGLSTTLAKRSTAPRHAISPDGDAAAIKKTFESPYKLVASFALPGRVTGFEVVGDRMVVAATDKIYVYGRDGSLLNNFSADDQVRDIAFANGEIYLLLPTGIEVYNLDGEQLRHWEACSEESDYCSMALAGDYVFATDAANKNISQYTKEGNFRRFISSPNGFIIPSYSFGITAVGDVVYSSNPGRHQVEKYTLDGEYVGAFGKAGGAAGLFCGCCNPVRLSCTSTGEIITSEKGNPRISCYSSDGTFRSMLLDKDMLGGGNSAYYVKTADDKLFIAGRKMVTVFQYDPLLAVRTACSTCGVDCPLRRGVNV